MENTTLNRDRDSLGAVRGAQFLEDILDVNLQIELLTELNVKVERPTRDTCIFEADDVDTDYLASETFRKKSGRLRGSVMLAGPMLARFRKAYMPKPGGDKIGRRRLDTHITGFEKLGAKFEYSNNFPTENKIKWRLIFYISDFPY